MINVLRKHQQFLMIMITVLVIIAFVWLYNGTQFDRIIDDEIATIYGRPVGQTEVDRQARRFQLCADLGFMEMLQDLAGMARFDRSQMFENFVWNSFVLRHEAEQLHITPPDEKVAAEIQSLRAFQTNGAFDANKYNAFLQEKLTPRGFTTTELENVVRDQLRLRKIKSLLSSAIELSPAEMRSAYEQAYQKIELSVVRLNLEDFSKTVQVTDEELQKAYEQRKESLTSDEKRKVKLVQLALAEEEKKLAGKERIDALQKLANRANELTQAMLEEGAKFEEVAGKLGLAVTTTGAFSQNAPDPALAGFPALTASAFKLTRDDPDSDVIQTENAFFVLHLDEVQEPKPLTFEEAKPRLAEQLRQERARELLSLKGAELRNKLEAESKAGKSFADAAADAGQKVQKIPAHSPAEAGQNEATDIPDLGNLYDQAAQLAEGQISPFIPAPEGGLLIHVDKRLPIDEEKFAKEKEQFGQSYLRGKRELAFQEWLRVRREAAQITMLKS